MCDEISMEAPENPVWDRPALEVLRHEFHASPNQIGVLLEAEEEAPAFDPIQVRNFLRAERARGREPRLLILGRIEMASFRHFVSRGFGQESGSPLGGLYFLGVPVVADVSPTRMEFVLEEESPTNEPGGRTAA